MKDTGTALSGGESAQNEDPMPAASRGLFPLERVSDTFPTDVDMRLNNNSLPGRVFIGVCQMVHDRLICPAHTPPCAQPAPGGQRAALLMHMAMPTRHVHAVACRCRCRCTCVLFARARLVARTRLLTRPRVACLPYACHVCAQVYQFNDNPGEGVELSANHPGSRPDARRVRG